MNTDGSYIIKQEKYIPQAIAEENINKYQLLYKTST